MTVAQVGRVGETSQRTKTVLVLAPPVLLIILGPSWLTAAAVAAFVGLAWVELAMMSAQDIAGKAIIAPWVPYVAAAGVCLWLLRVNFGPGALLFALLVAFVGDTGAYLGGKRFGRHKLWPAVSPGKTWEGAAFGLLGSQAAVVAAQLGLFTQLGWQRGALIALVGGVVGQCGDLAESKLKRRFSLKDSSGLLPGHGGILDRMDAAMPVAILTLVVLNWTH